MAAAVYYPSPEMRSMGDVDFLVPKPVLELLDAHRETVLAHWLPEAKTDDA